MCFGENKLAEEVDFVKAFWEATKHQKKKKKDKKKKNKKPKKKKKKRKSKRTIKPSKKIQTFRVSNKTSDLMKPTKEITNPQKKSPSVAVQSIVRDFDASSWFWGLDPQHMEKTSWQQALWSSSLDQPKSQEPKNQKLKRENR